MFDSVPFELLDRYWIGTKWDLIDAARGQMWTLPYSSLTAWLIYWVSCWIFMVPMTIPEAWLDFPTGQPAPPCWNKEAYVAIGHICTVRVAHLGELWQHQLDETKDPRWLSALVATFDMYGLGAALVSVLKALIDALPPVWVLISGLRFFSSSSQGLRHLVMWKAMLRQVLEALISVLPPILVLMSSLRLWKF
ncbi:hypothetical protein JCGZ_06881 [Jatropha curcas]|uniref:Uncharacterized protein n=1 Tax=Jatropha curcas TaxID=180498 RepID=A0A067L0X7_JATCU|nr:hypothetical protein JCGZ_06881 [Jatropha curcas]